MEKININGAIIMNNEPNKGLIYSEDKGKTWYYSNVKTGHFPFISIAGNTVIAHNNFNDDFHYSNDYGKTWYKVNTNNIPPKPYIVGVEIPNPAKNLVTTPLLPSKSIQE